MAQDQAAVPAESAGAGQSGGPTSVVEWGDEAEAPPGRTGRRLAQLRADRRLAPLVAGVAALALFGSLLSEWRIWTASDQEIQPQRITNGVVSFPAVGAAYLVGLLVLASCAVLALHGAGPVRRYARLVGMAATAVLGALVIAAIAHMAQLGGTIDDFIVRNNGGTAADVEYGRGVYLAMAGLVAAALALYLAAPARPAAAAGPAEEDDERDAGDEDTTTVWAPDDGGDDWPWRPRDGRRGSASPAGPIDLTVEPSAPFLPPADETPK